MGTRTLRRKPEQQRWDPENVKLIGGVPWKTSAMTDYDKDDGMMPDDKITEMPEPRRRMEEDEQEEVRASVEIPRSFNIRKTDLEEHGYTKGCLGCRAVLRGGTRQGHNMECRKRFEK